MKKRYDKAKECVNYAVQCSMANNCNNCKHKVVGYITDKFTGAKRLGLKGCKQGFDTTTKEDKQTCFECSQEGAAYCKAD